MTGSAGLLEALPRHQTAHAALLADILDVLHGASPAARQQSSPPPAQGQTVARLCTINPRTTEEDIDAVERAKPPLCVALRSPVMLDGATPN
jgi:hypothetical protein